MGRASWKRGIAALGLVVGVSAGMPLSGHASGGSGCTGGKWTVMSSPALTGSAQLNAALALSSTDVWAAGSQSFPAIPLVSTQTGDLFEHWDGNRWTTVPGAAPVGGLIDALSGTSFTDVWAFGSLSNAGAFSEHWDGTHWSAVPDPTAAFGGLVGGVDLGANDVWAVGNFENPAAYGGFLQHWNGLAWSVVKVSPFQPFGDIAATSDSDIWISAGAQTEHWDGSTWTTQAVAATAGTNTWMNQIAIAGTSRWVSGYVQNLTGATDLQPDLQSWKNGAWTEAAIGSTSLTSAQLWGMSAASATDVWAVGFGTTASGGTAGIAEHWDGTQWTSIPPLTPSGLIDTTYKVSALPGQAWAVGYTNAPNALISQPLIETYCS